MGFPALWKGRRETIRERRWAGATKRWPLTYVSGFTQREERTKVPGKLLSSEEIRKMTHDLNDDVGVLLELPERTSGDRSLTRKHGPRSMKCLNRRSSPTNWWAGSAAIEIKNSEKRKQ